MSRFFKISGCIGVVMLAVVEAFRRSRELADLYAARLYPGISAFLSRISSAVPFSLQDVAIVVIIAAAVLIIVLGVRRKRRWWKVVLQEANLALWIFVWVYAGWGINYSRSSIFARVGVQPEEFSKEHFCQYLAAYTETLNAAWTDAKAEDTEAVLEGIKGFYSSVPESYGLCAPEKWQRPKTMTFSGFYSKMGIQGYIGPLFCESHLNRDLLEVEYPFVCAHEYSHLLGVSNEAEANWWGYQACISSDSPAIRYSGYLYILTHIVVNAKRILDEEEFKAWAETIRPEVKADFEEGSDHWLSLRSKRLAAAQRKIYDAFLKSNRVSSGVLNYSQVVSLLISLDDISGKSTEGLIQQID